MSGVANLLMARATGRSRQFAIATALGASRGRLLSGLLLEAAILAVTGGVVPDQPVSKLATLDDFILETFWLIKVLGSIFTAFGLSALFLAAVGLYGVMANSVTLRRE